MAAFLQIETNTRLDNIQIELYGVCDSALIDRHTKEVKKSKEISSLKCTLQYLRQKGHHGAFRQLLHSAQSTNPNQGMIVNNFAVNQKQRENYPQLKFEFESSLETQIYEALMAHNFDHVMSLLR